MNTIKTDKPCPVCSKKRLQYDSDEFTYYCSYCSFRLNISEAVHQLQQVFITEQLRRKKEEAP